MIATFKPRGSDTKKTLAKGSSEGEPMSGLTVQVSRQTRILSPIATRPSVLPNGGQTIALSFNTYRAKSSGALHAFASLASPSCHETGTLEITAPDGAVLIFSPAVLTSRKASPVAGKTSGWSYAAVATDYTIAPRPGRFLLDIDGTLLRDIDAAIIEDVA